MAEKAMLDLTWEDVRIRWREDDDEVPGICYLHEATGCVGWQGETFLLLSRSEKDQTKIRLKDIMSFQRM